MQKNDGKQDLFKHLKFKKLGITNAALPNPSTGSSMPLISSSINIQVQTNRIKAIHPTTHFCSPRMFQLKLANSETKGSSILLIQVRQTEILPVQHVHKLDDILGLISGKEKARESNSGEVTHLESATMVREL